MRIFDKTYKASSRRQINIKEVKDGILVLPGDRYRVILETSAINFELKSEMEKDSLTDNFQTFLNSLPCPIQIIVRTRELDIDSYLEEFDKYQNKETEEVYKQQLKNYAVFIKKLVLGSKILSRRFYIVIPYKVTHENNEFSFIKAQLQLSEDIITKALEKLGIKVRHLGNLEILDLFYNIYNPTQIKTQPLSKRAFSSLFTNTYDF